MGAKAGWSKPSVGSTGSPAEGELVAHSVLPWGTRVGPSRAKLMAQIANPNVVPGYDIEAYGQVFIAMELVEGR